MAEGTLEKGHAGRERWRIPEGGRWAYLITSFCGLLLLPDYVAFIDVVPDGRELRQAAAAAVVAVIVFSVISLVRPTIGAWCCLVFIVFAQLVHALVIIQTFAFSAWLALAVAGVIPLRALWSVRPVRQ